MPEITGDVFVSLWMQAKAGQSPADADLARMQKFMLMHDDMHEHLDRFAANPSCPMEVDGENLMLHIAMDAATEKTLETDEPAGIRDLMQSLLSAGIEPGRAFHVLSQAMLHAFIIAAGEEREMAVEEYLQRAADYSRQVIAGSTVS